MNVAVEKKLVWLRSQLVSRGAEFSSSFGRRRITYADTTATGQPLLYIENYIIQNVLPFYGNTHTNDSHVGSKTTTTVKEATHYIKNCLGASTENDALLFCGSGATAAIKRLQEVIGIAVPPTLRSKVVLSDEDRWVVFVGPHEHHSNLLSWRHSLAEVVQIGEDSDGFVDLNGLKDELERFKGVNRPMLGSFSACSNVTGICPDTRAIARLLHEYGAFACFDFASSGPHVKIDMRSGEMDGYDAIFLSPHKFLGGPGSPGILVMSKLLYQLSSTPPSTCGGGTVSYVNGFNDEDTIYYADVEVRENAGTPQITQIVKAALAFWVMEFIGHKTIEFREHSFIQRALERLKRDPKIQILGNKTVNRHSILSFLVYPIDINCRNDENNIKCGQVEKVKEESKSQSNDTKKAPRANIGRNNKNKPLSGTFVAKLLNDLFGIQARGGCACAGPYGHLLLNVNETYSLAIRSIVQKGYEGVKPGWTRISFPFYLSEAEFEYILGALEFVSTHGESFLSLYNFDFKTGSWSFKSKQLSSQLSRLLKNKFQERNKSKRVIGHASRKTGPGPNLSKLSNKVKNLNVIEDSQVKKDDTVSDLSSEHSMCLEQAEYLAGLIPMFLVQNRDVPKEVDIDLPFLV